MGSAPGARETRAPSGSDLYKDQTLLPIGEVGLDVSSLDLKNRSEQGAHDRARLLVGRLRHVTTLRTEAPRSTAKPWCTLDSTGDPHRLPPPAVELEGSKTLNRPQEPPRGRCRSPNLKLRFPSPPTFDCTRVLSGAGRRRLIFKPPDSMFAIICPSLTELPRPTASICELGVPLRECRGL